MNKVFIKNSKIGGKGIFAKRGLKKGELVGVVKGKVVPDSRESYQKYGADHLHPISYSEALLNRNFTKYTNHSCDPNCGLKEGVKIVAMKPIQKGEEITIDYDTLEYDWKMHCNCGSKRCRKEIKGYKFLDKKLKQKYKRFISPHLLKKPIFLSKHYFFSLSLRG